MTLSVPSPNDMIKILPSNPLPAVSKDVTYTELTKLLKSIKYNYKYIYYLLGWVDNILIDGASSDMWYNMISPVVQFETPTNPGVTPQIAVGATTINDIYSCDTT